MSIPELVPVADVAAHLADPRFDALVVVSPGLQTGFGPIDAALGRAGAVDARLGKDVLLVPAPEVAGGRVILAPTEPLTRDYDDVRRIGDAARAGVVRARDAGAKAPLLIVIDATKFDRALSVAVLGALAGLWEPLEAREA